VRAGLQKGVMIFGRNFAGSLFVFPGISTALFIARLLPLLLQLLRLSPFGVRQDCEDEGEERENGEGGETL
jgi:hypothetical protein